MVLKETFPKAAGIGQALKMTLVRGRATDRKRGQVILFRLKQKPEAGEINLLGTSELGDLFFQMGSHVTQSGLKLSM